MVPKTLIDGYNLLFESPLVGRDRSTGWLERSRRRLLSFLCSRLMPEEQRVTQIIFDHHARGPLEPSPQRAGGISIRFATEYPEADDLLEEIIRQHPTPKLLRVVSSDLRIRACARARRAQIVLSPEFLVELEQRPVAPHPAGPAPGTVAEPSRDGEWLPDADEVEFWLRKFTGPGDAP